MHGWTKLVAVLAMSVGSATTAGASSVTPEIIFGTGNDNGSFTIATVDLDGIFAGLPGTAELGLRAKLRYDDTGQPQNTFNWDGVDTYRFTPTLGTPSDRSVFNFEWSIYVDAETVSASGGPPVPVGLDTIDNLFDFELSFDINPGPGASFVTYDPLAGPAYYGDLSTPNGGASQVVGVQAGATVAQQSVNYGFLTAFGAPLGTGEYDIRLAILSSSGSEIGSSQIAVNVVPVPAALPLMLAGLGAFAWAGRRKRKAHAA